MRNRANAYKEHFVRRSCTVTAFCLLLIAYASGASEGFKNDPVPKVNNEAGLALKGYDPVAYFEDGKPALGDPAIGYRWHGISYHFVSEQHRKAFIARPARYLPQYGGYCAYAVSEGTTADGDPQLWAVVDEKLYLNNNPVAKKTWDENRPSRIKAGDRNWPHIPKIPSTAP
jgi:hypothetical protein